MKDDDIWELQTYQFEKLDSKVNKVFSKFGDRRYIIITKDKKLIKVLNDLKWENKKYNMYLSPIPVTYGEESKQFIDLAKILDKHNMSRKIEVYCTIATVNLENLK